MRVGVLLAAVIGVAVSLGCDRSDPGGSAAVPYGLVVANGRVVDPESGLDAVRHVAIRNGSIAAIFEQPLQGRDAIDASGLVVAPGFIDLHAHGQDERSALLQAQDGVTTALDLESGVYPVETWYRSREGKAPIHFGASASHRAARIYVNTAVQDRRDSDGGHGGMRLI